jgi:hypothetical protein
VRAPGVSRLCRDPPAGAGPAGSALHWRRCGGRLRLIATLHDPAVIRKILAHLALAHSGQSPGPAPPASSAAAS